MIRKRGIALLTVLMSAVVLVMLSTTFVQLGRNGFLSIRQYEVRSIAMQACDSGLDYARAQLVQTTGWATGPFGSGNVTLDDPSLIRVEEVGADVTSNVVNGVLHRSESSFRVQVVNNLRGRARRPAPAWSRSGCQVPPRCALVAVEGTHKDVERRIEVLLTRRSVFDGAVRAGETFAVNVTDSTATNTLVIASNAPQSNQVTANGNIILPPPQAVLFENRGGRGQLKSGADVSINSTVSFDSAGNVTSSTGVSLLTSPANVRAQAANTMQATVQTNAPPAVARFQPDHLKAPAFPEATIPGGTYKFTSANSILIVPESGGGNITATGTFSYGGATVELSNYRFLPQNNVRVNGNFTLQGEIARRAIGNGTYVGNETIEPFSASLGIGYDPSGIPIASEDAAKSRFVVDGNLTVQGDLAGSGQLFVNQNSSSQGGDILIEGNSQMSASRTNGMAILAEGAIKIAEVSAQSATAPFAMDAADFQLFGQAVGNLTSGASIFDNWRESDPLLKVPLVGDFDFPDTSTLRGQIISPPGGYRNFVNTTLLSTGYTSGGVNLGNQTFALNITGLPPSLTGEELVEAFVDKVEADYSQMTVGMHMRVREFLKSVDRGAPNVNLINVWDLTAFGEQDNIVQGLVASQVSAYDQDARVKGLTVTDFLAASNPYSNGMRRDLIFGGILYGEGNIYTKIHNNFNLLGTMFSNQSISFENLAKGSLTFDPASFEDHFDLAKLGLGVAFYWSDT